MTEVYNQAAENIEREDVDNYMSEEAQAIERTNAIRIQKEIDELLETIEERTDGQYAVKVTVMKKDPVPDEVIVETGNEIKMSHALNIVNKAQDEVFDNEICEYIIQRTSPISDVAPDKPPKLMYETGEGSFTEQIYHAYTHISVDGAIESLYKCRGRNPVSPLFSSYNILKVTKTVTPVHILVEE